LTVRNAASVYFQSLGEQSGVYRGTEYTGYPFQIKVGHQFFESEAISYGSVFYDGILYENVPMRFDIIKDQLVVRYVDQVSGISLHNEKIDFFSYIIIILSILRRTISIPVPCLQGFTTGSMMEDLKYL
jgi:hypothetical protein